MATRRKTPTVFEDLQRQADVLKSGVRSFVSDHCTLHDWTKLGDGVPVSTVTPYSWKALSKEGRKVHYQLARDYRRFADFVLAMCSSAVQSSKRNIREADKLLMMVFEQKPMRAEPAQRIHDEIATAFDTLLGAVTDLFDPDEGTHYYVPDLKSVLHSSDLARWRFKGARKFTIVLMPSVVEGLDRLKVARDAEPQTRQRAQSVLDQIKACRAKGEVTRGVPLDEGATRLLCFMIESSSNYVLPWLSVADAEDAFLISVFHVAKTYSRSSVTIVTRELSLQNKVERAGLHFVDL